MMDLPHKHPALEPNRSVLRFAATFLAAAAVLMAAMAMAPDLDRAAAKRSRADVTKALLGTWSLKSTAVRGPDGSVVGSLYKDPAGKLTYTKRGDMWAFVGERDRTTRPDASTWYTGTFSVRAKAKEVVHHVEFSSPPSLEGTDQIRNYRLRKNRLKLSVANLDLNWVRLR